MLAALANFEDGVAVQFQAPGDLADQVFDVNKVQARQVREQHHQQAGFPASEFVQHN